MKKIMLLGMVSAVLFGACQPSEEVDLLPGEWRVLRLKPFEGPAQNAGADYILRFSIDGTFSLRLDVNTCWGAYIADVPGSILISGVGCTRVCCDTEFAERLTLILGELSHFVVEGRRLTLSGAGGEIVARRV